MPGWHSHPGRGTITVSLRDGIVGADAHIRPRANAVRPYERDEGAVWRDDVGIVPYERDEGAVWRDDVGIVPYEKDEGAVWRDDVGIVPYEKN